MKILTKLKAKVKILKSQVHILRIAYSDKRTPLIAKLLIGLTVGYLLSPIDLIPDLIPILGLLDDLIIVPILISISIKLIPEIVLSDAKKELKTNPEKIKKNNWFFAILIIIFWICIIYVAFKIYEKQSGKH
ncbi:DUF1232 domain-containing protein [Gelidibacter sp.]|uniref:YkvA family protein n=1 Tax=Gelidibacter sp. TaxID=2018083 RepID=UPI00326332AE